MLLGTDENAKAKTTGTDVFEGLWVRPMRSGCDHREPSLHERILKTGCCEATNRNKFLTLIKQTSHPFVTTFAKISGQGKLKCLRF